jgi:hypothetical protein
MQLNEHENLEEMNPLFRYAAETPLRGEKGEL